MLIWIKSPVNLHGKFCLIREMRATVTGSMAQPKQSALMVDRLRAAARAIENRVAAEGEALAYVSDLRATRE